MLAMPSIWNTCIDQLKGRVAPGEIDAWLLPLRPVQRDNTLKLLAPNRYVCEHVRKNFLPAIEDAVHQINREIGLVQVEVGGYASPAPGQTGGINGAAGKHPSATSGGRPGVQIYAGGAMDPEYTFERHVEGGSNQMARAAAMQVGRNPGKSYNPLFIYGGVGLGKTHLMQAAGHLMRELNPNAKVAYVRSETFFVEMVDAIRNKLTNEFKRHYRSLNALLIDDIHFFAKKSQTQEEFFNTFNALMEGQRQIILASDRIPNAIPEVDDRLISRFSSGLTVRVEPPELETRVAILEKKALGLGVELPHEAAFFVAQAVRSSVRELEGALHRIAAMAGFTGRAIDVELAREALRDLLMHQEQQLNIENIQQSVAEYYKIRVADLRGKSRRRAVVRPRQMAMYFAKEYTNHSLPYIGDRFGGRDHSTVLHAHRKIADLLQTDVDIKTDHRNLQRLFGV